MLPSYRFMCGFALLALGVGSRPARADDPAGVKMKLDRAKTDYDQAAEKFNKGVLDWLDKREAEARKAGGKKLVDQLKAERAAFEKRREPPARIPPALLDGIRGARASLDKEYSEAVKGYLQMREDKAAEAAEKEQNAFLLDSAALFGKRTYLAQLKAFDVKALKDWYELNSEKAKIDGEFVPRSILLHPEASTFSSASFNIGKRAVVFRAIVGVPQHEQISRDPESPLTFEVLGDGKSLWKSEPVQKRSTFQTCTIRVEKVKTLTLRVHCEGSFICAHGTWFAPFVAE